MTATKQAATAASTQSPGQLLGDKRREYGWSVREVADAMQLSEQQITAIEQDNYDSLAGATYIMGYWRSYSQLLKISIDAAIHNHRANIPLPVGAAAGHCQVTDNTEKSRKHVAGLCVGLLVVCLLAIWYWQYPGADERKTATAGHSDLPAPIEPGGELPTLPVPNFTEAQAVERDTRGHEVIVVAPVDDKVATNNQVAAAQPAAEPAKPKPPKAVTAPQQLASNAQIVFKVTQESWVDVRDNSGERLIYRTVNRGEDIRLQGKPPYSVFIGSPDDVAVEYQGKNVPFKAHETGLFARFEVGAK